MAILKYRGSVYMRDCQAEPQLRPMTVLRYRGTLYSTVREPQQQDEQVQASCPKILKYRGSCYFMASRSVDTPLRF